MALDSAVVDQFSNPLWRLNNLYSIIDKDGRHVPFRLNTSQEELVKNLHGRDIILKARQIGFTTLVCIVSLDECLFNPNWRAAIIAHKLDDAKDIFRTKVKFPYDNLPDQLKERLTLTQDSADTLSLSNGSSVQVKTSARSGTLQRLHISEFGKICAHYPEKAREIVTGSLPAAERGQITIESTAEGQEGRFYEMCQEARKHEDRELSRLQYRFHFFPWWKQGEYRADPALVTITQEDKDYFQGLKDQGIDLDDHQKAWWVLTEKTKGGDMLREYPATPDEAFEQAIEGSIFERQLAHAYKHKRVGDFPFDPNYPVNSFWDIGKNDLNVIWLHQRIRERDRFIGYYENSGEHISHYLGWLRDWAKEHDASWDRHYLPHDAKRDDMFHERDRLEVMADLGFRPEIVTRTPDKWAAIETARNAFANCDWHEAGVSKGLKRLRHYRKEWDEARAAWKNRPFHDDNSNAADAFMTYSAGYIAPVKHAPYAPPAMGTMA